MVDDASGARRIVMAFDASSTTIPVIEVAAGLALGLGAELLGLYVEDERLLRSAALPFARELGFTSAHARSVTTPDIERALRVQALQLRRLIGEIADRLALSWTLEVIRGEVPDTVLRCIVAPDLLVVGRSGWQWDERRQGDPRRQAVQGRREIRRGPQQPQAAGDKRLPSLAMRPIAVMFNDSPAGQAALSAARQLAEVAGEELVVLIPAADPETFRRRRQQAATELGHFAARYLHLPENDFGAITRAAHTHKIGVLLWPDGGERIAASQLSALPCPLVIVN